MTYNYVAIESSTGDVYQVAASSQENAFRTIAKHILKMPDWNRKDFDTGNVDFDLYPIVNLLSGNVEKLVLGG